jgi:acylphosphatase
MPVVARLLVIHGRVQGVGYRDAAVQAAFACAVTGWVRNRHGGTVEAFVQGPAPAVEGFIAWCRRGPPLARVTHVDVVDGQPDPARHDFEWRPTAA